MLLSSIFLVVGTTENDLPVHIDGRIHASGKQKDKERYLPFSPALCYEYQASIINFFFLLIQLVLVFSLLLHYQTLLTLTLYGLARL